MTSNNFLCYIKLKYVSAADGVYIIYICDVQIHVNPSVYLQNIKTSYIISLFLVLLQKYSIYEIFDAQTFRNLSRIFHKCLIECLWYICWKLNSYMWYLSCSDRSSFTAPWHTLFFCVRHIHFSRSMKMIRWVCIIVCTTRHEHHLPSYIYLTFWFNQWDVSPK